jgi:hypothetical protein
MRKVSCLQLLRPTLRVFHRSQLDSFSTKRIFNAMHTFLIIVPDGGMLFEAAGIADILMQANRLMSKDAPTPAYQVTVAE